MQCSPMQLKKFQVEEIAWNFFQFLPVAYDINHSPTMTYPYQSANGSLR